MKAAACSPQSESAIIPPIAATTESTGTKAKGVDALLILGVAVICAFVVEQLVFGSDDFIPVDTPRYDFLQFWDDDGGKYAAAAGGGFAIGLARRRAWFAAAFTAALAAAATFVLAIAAIVVVSLFDPGALSTVRAMLPSHR